MSVNQNIAEYMSIFGNREYTAFDVGIISKAIRLEFEDRKDKCIEINSKTKEGRKQIRERTVLFANNIVNKTRYCLNDIITYRKCVATEYENRTGKCAWGYKSKKIALGYDAN